MEVLAEEIGNVQAQQTALHLPREANPVGEKALF